MPSSLVGDNESLMMWNFNYIIWNIVQKGEKGGEPPTMIVAEYSAEDLKRKFEVKERIQFDPDIAFEDVKEYLKSLDGGFRDKRVHSDPQLEHAVPTKSGFLTYRSDSGANLRCWTTMYVNGDDALVLHSIYNRKPKVNDTVLFRKKPDNTLDIRPEPMRIWYDHRWLTHALPAEDGTLVAVAEHDVLEALCGKRHASGTLAGKACAEFCCAAQQFRLAGDVLDAPSMLDFLQMADKVHGGGAGAGEGSEAHAAKVQYSRSTSVLQDVKDLLAFLGKTYHAGPVYMLLRDSTWSVVLGNAPEPIATGPDFWKRVVDRVKRLE